MLSKTDRLIQQQIARYFSRLSAVTKIGLLMRSPSVNMNEDGEADANDLASEFETDRTRQKIRRDLAKFRRRLQERVQLLLSGIKGSGLSPPEKNQTETSLFILVLG